MMNDIKSVFASRTVWLAIAQGIAGVLVALYATDPSLTNIGWLAVVKSIIDFYLRMNTTQQVSLSGN